MIEHTLQRYWGYTDFRKNQKAIITSVIKKKDVLAVLATGGGKSLCYQLPTIHQNGICVVISPLIALIQDQINDLSKRNIKALTIPSGSTSEDIIRIMDNLQFGGYSFLYLSPERLQSKLVQEKLRQIDISLIAVDEAHCISEWGHDFRPSYRNIKILRELLPKANCIALTGTATKKVIADICENLKLQEPEVFKESLFQENISYRIIATEDKYGKLIQILPKIKGSSIIYTNSRNGSEALSKYLNSKGLLSTFYHGGMTSEKKDENFKKWMSDSVKIMVATSAFGMGINKANVRCIIHYDLPSSIENYIQQVGRAGRDGKKAYGILFKNDFDLKLKNQILEQSLPSVKEVKNLYQKLFQFFSIAKGEQPEDYFVFHPLEFYDQYNLDENKSRAIFQLLQNNGVIEFDSNRQEKSSIQFICDSKTVQKYAIINIYIKNFINSLLRTYSGLYKQKVYINEFEISKRNSITTDAVFQYLEQLKSDKIIDFSKRRKGIGIRFLHPREDDFTINSISKNIKKYLDQKHIKNKEFDEYITNNSICRRIQIATYFDENITSECMKCDVCDKKNRSVSSNLETKIMDLLRSKKALTSAEICHHLDADESEILILLQELLARQKIRINSINKFSRNEE